VKITPSLPHSKGPKAWIQRLSEGNPWIVPLAEPFLATGAGLVGYRSSPFLLWTLADPIFSGGAHVVWFLDFQFPAANQGCLARTGKSNASSSPITTYLPSSDSARVPIWKSRHLRFFERPRPRISAASRRPAPFPGLAKSSAGAVQAGRLPGYEFLAGQPPGRPGRSPATADFLQNSPCR
jgi:hypothetical protein